jgi:hypothetical protein
VPADVAGIGGDDIVLPPFTIAMSGSEFSIPCLAANAAPDYNPQFQLADFLMWTGVSLDTSVAANRRLFMTTLDLGLGPKNPLVAVAALGTPKYWFQGDSTDFLVNRGTAGALTKTGTVTDYTPGP